MTFHWPHLYHCHVTHIVTLSIMDELKLLSSFRWRFEINAMFRNLLVSPKCQRTLHSLILLFKYSYSIFHSILLAFEKGAINIFNSSLSRFLKHSFIVNLILMTICKSFIFLYLLTVLRFLIEDSRRVLFLVYLSFTVLYMSFHILTWRAMRILK